jgi:hypothetical protein
MFSNQSKFVYLAFVGAITAQQIPDFIPPSNIGEQLNNVAKPVLEHLEPYKTKSFTRERGVPQLHEEYGK